MEEKTGYKVFKSDWTWGPKGLKYEVGKVYENVRTEIFWKPWECFYYYDRFNFSPKYILAEVLVLGDTEEPDYLDIVGDCPEVYTDRFMIVREISWEEALHIINEGSHNIGLGNSGNYNTGDENGGDWNTGFDNKGSHNTGKSNEGDYNTGNFNVGNRNTGSNNAGSANTGWGNSGDCNTGQENEGNYNTGWYNIGHYNVGDHNTGKNNTGSWNAGHKNTGDWNKSSYNTGCFNTSEQKLVMFNKPSDWTMTDWENSEARTLLNKMADYINSTEKKADDTTENNVDELSETKLCQLWWNQLSEEQKDIIQALPNFDAAIFEEITGIKVD